MELLWGDSSPRCHRGNYLVPDKEVVLVALGAQATRSRTSSDTPTRLAVAFCET